MRQVEEKVVVDRWKFQAPVSVHTEVLSFSIASLLFYLISINYCFDLNGKKLK